eukprot:365528-Chlamydomonas_euryale.AAC.6
MEMSLPLPPHSHWFCAPPSPFLPTHTGFAPLPPSSSPLTPVLRPSLPLPFPPHLPPLTAGT